MLEGDTIRLAGACFMSLAMSCMGLMVPLLPCCQDKSSESGDVSSYFLLRSIMFMQGMYDVSMQKNIYSLFVCVF